MRTDERTSRRLHLVSGQESPGLDRARLPSADELKPVPYWGDLLVVLGVCVLFWAGLSWLITAWV
jgi:hypothetical protein